MNKKKLLADIRSALKAAHDPERARNEKRYLKSSLDFFGVNIPTLRKIAKDIARANKDASRKEVMGLAERLWDSRYHQERTLGIMVLASYPEYLDAEAVPFIEQVLKECMGWDHADRASTVLMGSVLARDIGAVRHLVRWSASWGLWLRRSALTAQIRLLRRGEGDRETFFRLARGMVEEKEFFIRKAIGWTVRELSKADPEAAFEFLMGIREKASPLTLREGAKRLPDKMKKKVLKGL